MEQPQPPSPTQGRLPEVARIPLATGLNGQVPLPSVEFAAQSRVLMVTQWTTPADPWLVYHAPDMLAALSAVLMAASFRSALRWRRRRKLLGRMLCASCEYDLSPPRGGRVAAACPECGRSTAQTIANHSPAKLWMPVLACGVAAIVCAVVASTFLRMGTAGNAWPHTIMRSVIPGWPISRPSAPAPVADVRWILLGNPSAGWRHLSDASAGNLLVSEGASPVAAWICSSPANEWSTDLHTLDLLTGANRVVRMGSLPVDGFASISGFTADHAAAVVATVGTVGVEHTSGQVPVRLQTVSLADGAVREIAVGETAAWSIGTGSWRVPRVLTGVSSDGRDWRIVTLEGPDAGVMLSPHAGTFRRRSLTGVTNVVGALASTRTVTLRTDGTLVSDKGLEISADAAAVLPTNSPRTEWMASTQDGTVTLLRDGREVGLIGDPTPAQATAFASVVVSPDARWAAVTIVRTSTATKTSAGEVVLLDLASLRHNEKGPAEKTPRTP